MAGTPADSDAHTKTGTLNRVSALAGYVNTRDGELWAFDITMNDTPLRGAARAGSNRRNARTGFPIIRINGIRRAVSLDHSMA